MNCEHWAETTEEWHGADREFTLTDQTRTLNFMKIGGKGEHWDVVFHKTLGDFKAVKRHLGFEDAVLFAEDYLRKNP